jgi:hypothetical protein
MRDRAAGDAIVQRREHQRQRAGNHHKVGTAGVAPAHAPGSQHVAYTASDAAKDSKGLRTTYQLPTSDFEVPARRGGGGGGGGGGWGGGHTNAHGDGNAPHTPHARTAR